MKKLILAAMLALTTIPAQAAGELYIDLGAAYVSELQVREEASVTFGDYTVSAMATATLDVDQYAPMARVGYIWHGFGVEFDAVGVPDISLRRINMFYRFTFR